MRRHQHGMFLIEALIAILIFSLGILGLMAMGGAAVSAQSDARFRTEASNLADAIASEIALRVNRAGATPQAVATNIGASLPAFEHQPGGSECAFRGAEASDPDLLAAVRRARIDSSPTTGLPGALLGQQQVDVDTGEFNRVTITLCWQSPSDSAMRKHVLVTYVN